MTEPITHRAAGSSTATGTWPTTRFSILGQVRAERGAHDLEVGGPQQRVVLMLLLAQAGRVVSADDLVEALWDGDAPPSACNVLHRHIGNIRRLCEPWLPPRSAGSHLHRHGNGYRMLVGDDDLDLLRFRRHAREGSSLAATDAIAALRLYVEALRQWEGPITAGYPGGREHPVVAGVEAERVSVLVEAADCALRAGQAPVVLALLRAAAWQHPFDERLHARYLLCLAESGRRAEALHGWRRLQRRLRDELGVQPGEELVDLLTVLQAAPCTTTAPGPRPPVPAEPIGRSVQATHARQPDRTAVAVRLALAHDDGRLHVSVRGISPFADPARTHDVLTRFFESWGLADSDPTIDVIPSTGPYRNILVQHRRILSAGVGVPRPTCQPAPPGGLVPSQRGARV